MLDDGARRRLEAAYREWGAELWRAVYAYSGGQREVTDEAVAEAFAQAGRRLGAIRSLRPWVFTAAFRIGAAELKRRASVMSTNGQRSPAPESTAEARSEIRGLLRGLSPNQRAAFVLREGFGYTSTETARLLGISEVAVRVHLHGARRRLRERTMEGERG